jgi:hypothetical protein
LAFLFERRPKSAPFSRRIVLIRTGSCIPLHGPSPDLHVNKIDGAVSEIIAWRLASYLGDQFDIKLARPEEAKPKN